MTDEKKNRVPPSGGQTGSAAMSSPGQPQQQADGEEALRMFPAHVEAALAYAAENKYDYGPKFRNLELEHSVVNARLMTRDIVRVTLEYQPTGKFRGVSGTEYFDVDGSGAILARRQLRVPRENMPWVLIGLATISVIAAAVLVPVILLIDPTGDPLYVAGRTLWIRSEEPKAQPYIYYTGPDVQGVMQNWIVLPEGEGTEMAMVQVTVINQTSGAVTLLVDRDAATLLTGTGVTVRPVNILERAQWPQGEPDRRYIVPGFIPMWGSTVLQEGEQIQGYLVFEVPAGSGFQNLRWIATDSVTIRYE